MKILTIAGSVRESSLTKRAVGYINAYLQNKEIDVKHIDLKEYNLVFPGQGESSKELIELVKSVDAVIFATPEYHGSYSAVMKLFIENLEYPSVLSGKPVALVGVAAGVLGATKALEHLHSVCRHLKMLSLPEAVSIASCYQVFDKEGKLIDENIRQRLDELMDRLIIITEKLS